MKVHQRVAGAGYFLSVWEPGAGYRLASLGTRDRDHAARLALAAHAARSTSDAAASWASALATVRDSPALAQAEPPAANRDGVTLGALWARFSTTAGVHLDNADRSRADARHRAALLVGYFGADHDVHTLDEDAQYRYVAARRQGGVPYRDAQGRDRVTRPTGPRSPEADLSLLRAMLGWATRVRCADGAPWLGANPLTGARRPRGPVDRRRPVATHQRFRATLASMRRLREAATSDAVRRRWLRMELALLLAEGTGRRLGAIRLLRWEDVDWGTPAITWRPESDKARREWRTPLSPALLAQLGAYARALTGHHPVGQHLAVPAAVGFFGPLFAAERLPGGVMDRHLFDHWLRVAERAAGLPKLPGGLWHPYRRKWAVERKHHPLSDVAAVGGWTDLPTLMACYALPDAESMRRVMSEPRRYGASDAGSGGGIHSHHASRHASTDLPSTARRGCDAPRAARAARYAE